MFEIKKNFVLGLVLDETLMKVLLVKRVKEPYKDCLNGIGGKVEPDETIEDAMRRELSEETDIEPFNVRKMRYMMTILYPDAQSKMSIFYFVLNNTYEKKEKIVTREGDLIWYDFIEDMLYDSTKPYMAGEGNVAYFLNYALMLEGIDTNILRNGNQSDVG